MTTQTLDVRRLYRCRLPGGRAVDVVFREPGISHDLSFGGLLGDGARLASRLREAMGSGEDDALLAVSVDGETWGHHHRFGEMALAFALRLLREDPSVVLLPPAAFRAHRPPEHEVQLWERTAWSCAHGVERWRSDCGCNVGAGAGWNQAWRTPLRQAVDWLRDELAFLYQDRAGLVLRDPWGARDRYIDVIIDPGRIDEFLLAEAGRRTSSRRAVVARRALEMARHALLMQTSCGWFFDDLANIETVQVLKHAGRALELAGRLGANLEAGFVERLEIARSNIASEGTGADVWRRRVRDHAPGPSRVAATTAMLTLLERPIPLPGYSVSFSTPAARGTLAGTASVTETSTGATETVTLRAEHGENDAPTCTCGGERFSLEDLFGVQREGAIAALARETMLAARAGRRAALGRVRPLLGPLLSDGVPLPSDLAIIVGWDEAETLAHAARVGDTSLEALAERAARLHRHGVIFPAAWLAERFGRLLEREVARLPEGAEAALRLLDLAEAAGVVLDVAPAQAVALAWWRLASAEMLEAEAVRVLRDRLGLSPDIG